MGKCLHRVYIGFSSPLNGSHNSAWERNMNCDRGLGPLFLWAYENFMMLKLYHIVVIWYICTINSRIYGKSYSRASYTPY